MTINYLETGFTKNPDINAPKIINEILDLAKLADNLGYGAFWMSEHYTPEYSWIGSPEMYLPIIAGITDRINVGTGAILAKYHNPLRLAQNFRILSALFPNRIDLGISNADIPIEMLHHVTNQDKYPDENFNETSKLLVEYIHNNMKMNLGGQEIKIHPNSGSTPRLWVMGNSDATINTAIDLKANLCLSIFHSYCELDKIKRDIDRYLNGPESILGSSSDVSVLVGIACSSDKSITTRLKDAYSNKPNHFIIGQKNECIDRLCAIREYLGCNSLTISTLTSNLGVKRETLSLKENL